MFDHEFGSGENTFRVFVSLIPNNRVGNLTYQEAEGDVYAYNWLVRAHDQTQAQTVAKLEMERVAKINYCAPDEHMTVQPISDAQVKFENDFPYTSEFPLIYTQDQDKPLPVEHPGTVLTKELAVRNFTPAHLNKLTRFNTNAWKKVCQGKANLTDEMIYELGQALKTGEDMWYNLQDKYDAYCAK